MSASTPDYTDRLRALMQPIGITTYKQLCQTTGVSEKVIRRLRRGQLQQMQIGTLAKIAQGLQISAVELLAILTDRCADQSTVPSQQLSVNSRQPSANSQPAVTVTAQDLKPPQDLQLEDLQLEYDRLQQQLQTQRETLWQAFQQDSLQTLESWLLQWPTAAYAAQQNPTAPAVKLLPLVKPVENLLKQWGLAPIGCVGETIPFDPQQHQVMGPTPNPGDPVRVRYIGYQQGDRLLHRAKVSLPKI